MRTTRPSTYRTVISPLEFMLKLPTIITKVSRIVSVGLETQRMMRSGITWGKVLEDTASRFPNNVAVKSPDGTLTYRELNSKANQYALFLLSKNVCQGDVVVLCLETRPELLTLYCACAKIGAISSMINTSQRGESLAHSFNLNKGKVVIIGEECLSFFNEAKANIDLSGSLLYTLKDTCSALTPAMDDISLLAAAMPDHNPEANRPMPIRAPAAHVYTSGTTGLPKAAVITNYRLVSGMFFWGRVVIRIRSYDTVYVPLPFCHTNALTIGWPPALYSGAAVALRRKFSASQFLSDVRKFNATYFVYVGEVCRYIMEQPEKPDDSQNPLRAIIGNGLRPDIWKPFKKRFGIQNVYELYGAAESSGALVNLFNFDYTVGMCLSAYAIVRYDTENDVPETDENGFLKRVKRGEAGLLIIKISDLVPFFGYSEKKKTEEKIIRNAFKKGDLWFNTGDILRDMGFRHAQFVDRLGDTFRWKGENVATMEVENVLNSFPGIAATAVYGVTMPAGDGKAGMASILVEEGYLIDPAVLCAHLKAALPKYAVPLFIRFVDDFQMTATHKIKKTQLRKEGYDPTQVKEKLYVLLPNSNMYVHLDKPLYNKICAGEYSF